MLAKQIIPCLDIKDGRVVKGVNFINLRDAGDPVEQARLYDEQGADELVFLDISATHEGRRTTLDLVGRVADTVFMPLTVGGGIRTVEEMHALLLAGADKVSVNSAAVKQPKLLSEGAARFGAQCVVLAIDARRTGSRWEVYVNGGRVPTGLDAVEWAVRGVELGRWRNPAHQHGRGWNTGGLRSGIDTDHRRGSIRARDSVWRRGNGLPFCRGAHAGKSRCRTGCLAFP